EYHVAGVDAQQFHAVPQVIHELLELRLFRQQAGEDRYASQVVLNGPFAIPFVQNSPRGFAALQDVKDVAENFQHRAVFLRAHRGRARVRTHAGHFAEDFTFIERGPRVVVAQRHGAVDVDVARL